MRKAIYAGSFDPITLGHLDIILRASKMFDLLYVAVADNPAKKHTYYTATRVAMVRRSIPDDRLVLNAYDSDNGDLFGTRVIMPHGDKNILIVALPYGRALVDYADELGACAMVRGMRPVNDFPGEYSLAQVNRKLNPVIETIWLVTSEEFASISSSMVRELDSLGIDTGPFVPLPVAERMREDR